MKKSKSILSLALLLVLAGCGGNDSVEQGGKDSGNESVYTGPKKTIIVDGGGDVGDFTTTKSMKESALNPYPYNTLETLCKEWEKKNPQYQVHILKTSSHGDRTVLVPQLEQKTAPDITYQSGTVINSDLGKNYYVNMSSYLAKPNHYIEGNQKWSDIYNAAELATTQASDGDYYCVNLERIPVGLMVNKTLLNNAGITSLPTTYKQFMADIDILKSGKLPAESEAYSTTYMWYNIALESNVFSYLLKDGDVLRQNGKIDTEELCRLYQKKMWQPDLNLSGSFEDNRYYDYLKICAELGKRKANKSFDTVSNFAAGKLAFMEATGKEMRNIAAKKDKMNFEWTIIPYPDLTTESYAHASNPCVRGSAGLATSWFVTSSAEKKGTVDGCVDLLMYLTAPEQNNRLIGDLKGGMPLNPTSDYKLADHLVNLNKAYWDDIDKMSTGERVAWGAICSWEVLGYAFNTAYIKNMEDVENGAKTVEVAATALGNLIKSTVSNKIKTEGWDTSAW